MSEPLTQPSLEKVRTVQRGWARVPVRQRLNVLQALRCRLASDPDRFTQSIQLPQRHSAADTIGAEILPLADACRFLQRQAERLLYPRNLGASGRPLWLWGTHTTLSRDPHGLVLIIGTWNYPLLLPGVQVLQALIAGNAVFVKPAMNSSQVMQLLKEDLESAGLPLDLLTILPEAPEAAQELIELGIDHVVLTGSVATGKRVLRQLADHLTPATMELSGCDALFVLPDADLGKVAKALAFGFRFNSSATCIAPRRIFIPRAQLRDFESKLREQLESLPKLYVSESAAIQTRQLVWEAIQQGASLWFGALKEEVERKNVNLFPVVVSDVTPDMEIARSDIFAPVAAIIPYMTPDDALLANRKCPYALSASVFGPKRTAEDFARQVEAGSVIVNDLIAPTADPRVAFGGRGRSGFGLTRGAEGLLSMTIQKAVIVRRGGWRMHFDPASQKSEHLLRGYLKWVHGGRWKDRIQGLWNLTRGAFS